MNLNKELVKLSDIIDGASVHYAESFRSNYYDFGCIYLKNKEFVIYICTRKISKRQIRLAKGDLRYFAEHLFGTLNVREKKHYEFNPEKFLDIDKKYTAYITQIDMIEKEPYFINKFFITFKLKEVKGKC